MNAKIDIKTGRRQEFVDITRRISDIVSKSGAKDGICVIWTPHTTSGIIINENADPDVPRDIQLQLGKMAPERGPYAHSEGNSDAHIKASLSGPSQSIIIENGSLMLGTWQGIFFAEYDGPRSRQVWVKVVKG